MLRTGILALLFLIGGAMAVSQLTHGFQVWTDEGARRLNVVTSPIPLPAVRVDGPATTGARLDTLLRRPGQVTIANFIYTHCVTLCLTLSWNIQQMQENLETEADAPGNAGVRLLSISFDGARDTPAVLARYAERWGADPKRWQFLRVPDAHEQSALLRRLGVVVVPDWRGDYEHNAALLILDGNGRVVRIFDMEERQLALNYARHLAHKELAESRS